jgi:large subunit ribosomal protein L10
MNREQKSAVVDEIADQIQSAEAIFAVDYRGLSVSAAADLRTKLRDADARFRIVKNSLTERAADKAGADPLKTMLEGPTALTFVHGDAALAAKALNDTARALNILEFKGGLMNGNALTADDVRSIARLPSREVLHAQLVGTIAAPISGLVRTLNALIAGVAIQLKAIADQGLVGSEGAGSEGAGSEGASSSETATQASSEDASSSETATQVSSEGASAAEAATQAWEAEPPSTQLSAEGEEPAQQTETDEEAASDAAASDE